MIQTNIKTIQANIEAICQRLGRDPRDIVFVGVTKYADIDQIRQVIEAGITHIGENRVQEAKRKFAALGHQEGMTRHLLGHLQTNKVKEAVALFDMIQSVDSLKVAREIDKHAAKINKVMDILIEINASAEAQKYGFAPQELEDVLPQIRALKHIRLLGLMSMAPLTEDQSRIRQCFQVVRELFDKDRHMKYLSMGMSHDYPIALEQGANMLRIGRAMFTKAKE